MKALLTIPHRLKLKAVILKPRGGCCAGGVGTIAVGVITRNLTIYADQPAAEEAAIDLADSLDLMAVRT